MAEEQAGVVGWVVAAAIDLWWSGLPRLPAGMATLPVAARASFGLSSLSDRQSSRSPALSGKHNRDSRPPPREEAMSKRLEAGLVLIKRSWQIVELLAIMFFL